LLAFAVAFVYDALTALVHAVDAYIDGDEGAFEDGVFDFLVLMHAADALWTEAVETLYLYAMFTFMADFEELIDLLVELLEDLDNILDDEEYFEKWLEDYLVFIGILSAMLEDLETLDKIAPQRFKHGHFYFEVSIESIYYAMESLLEAVDYLVEDDEDGFEYALIEFIVMFMMADEYWDDAVEWLYIELRDDLIDEFDELLEFIGELIELALEIVDKGGEKDFDEWYEMLREIFGDVNDLLEAFAFMWYLAPYNYEESHELMMLVVELFYESLREFEKAILEGKACECCVAEFIENMLAVKLLWLAVSE
jgi:tetratricopeptide (TPR) repeat protein